MAIAHVQTNSVNPGSVASQALAYGSNVTAGSLLVCALRYATGGQTVSVSDNVNGSWGSRKAVMVQTNDANGTIEIWIFENAASGATTVTVSYGVAATLRFAISEFSGAATASAFDTSSGAEATASASLASGAITPAANGALLYCAGFISAAATFTAGTDFTIPTNGAIPASPSSRLAVEYYIQPTAASHNGTFSVDASVSWAALLVALKAPGAATVVSPRPQTRPFPFAPGSSGMSGRL
jgi:hypothetical protein